MANSSAHFADEGMEAQKVASVTQATQLEGGGHGLELRPASVQGYHWVSSECPAQAGELLSGGWAVARLTACQAGAAPRSRRPWQQGGRMGA